MAQNLTPGERVDSPDLAEYPQDDNGENFWFSLVVKPMRSVLVSAMQPIRLIVAAVSAKTVDDECARRGAYIDEENPDVVDEVMDEYQKRFFRRGRR